MNISTTVPTTMEISLRRLAGVVVIAAASAATLTWALTAVAIDTTPEQTRITTATRQDVPAANPAATAEAAPLVAAHARPIIVADAYHGVGFTVCRGDAQTVAVADSYHGVGHRVCV